jgi:TolB-like protein/Flp pilus assembly protein TadD
MEQNNEKDGLQVKLENITLDLGTYKVLLHLQNRKEPLTIHFDKPARRFYFSLIALVVNEMKNLGKPEYIHIRKHEKNLTLLDTSLAGEKASKTPEGMWDKIRKAWRYTLPDLETGTHYKILERNLIQPYEKGGKYRYDCSDDECNIWTNLFDHDENNPWRFKFAIDSASLSLNDISLKLGELQDSSAWQEFVKRLSKQPKAVSKEKRAVSRWWKKAAISLIAFMIVGIATWAIWNSYIRPVPPTTDLGLSDKLSLAVLPFKNISDDPKQEYFADGITDDLITDLSKIAGLFVIASNSSFTYKGKPLDVRQVGRELGVRYVLEGSVRKSREKVRINAQLVDATTGHHLWAERFDGELKDIFALQDRFTRRIVAALAVQLNAGEEEIVARKYTKNVAAYEAYLQGAEHLRRMTNEDLAKAVPFFEKAVELDPDFGQAYTRLAAVYQASLVTGWYRELGWSNARSLRDKYLKLAMENPTAETHGMLSHIYTYKRQNKEAVAEGERAIALDPNNSQINFFMGIALLYAGRSSEAVDFFKRTMQLDPHYPVNRLHFLGLAQFSVGQFEDALTTLESAHARKPKFGEWPLWATYGHLGREQEAAELMTQYLKRRGGHKRRPTAEKLLQYYPFKDPTDEARFADGLIKVGLPRPWNPLYRGHYKEAIAKAEQAIAANPNDAEIQFAMGETLLFTGRFTEAAEHIKRAMKIDSKHPPFYYWYLSLAQFCQGQFDEAAVSLEKCYKGYPGESKWLLAATYAQLGRQQEAVEVLRKYMKRRGLEHFTVEKVLKYDGFHAFKDPKDTGPLAEGLQKSGLVMR